MPPDLQALLQLSENWLIKQKIQVKDITEILLKVALNTITLT
jgi:hypothetical protein